MHRWIRILIVVVVLGLLLGALAFVLTRGGPSGQPLIAQTAPTPTTATTGGAIVSVEKADLNPNQTYQAQYAAHLRHAFVETYRDKGARDPAWDDDALRFLDDFAAFLAKYEDDTFGHLFAHDDDLFERAKDLVARGSRDPIVLMVCEMVNYSTHTDMRTLIPQMQQRGFPPDLIASAASRFARGLHQQKSDDAERFGQIAAENLRRCVGGEAYGPGEQRLLFRQLRIFVLPGLNAAEQFVASVDQVPNVDPWIVEMSRGLYYSRVSDDYRHRDEDELEQARRKAQKHLSAAHELRPDYPEAAAEMIEVVDADEARKWFDRATRAQLDWEPAYENMRRSLMWMGHTALHKFGLECLETGRFDTIVPFQYIEALLMIADDARGGPRHGQAHRGEPDYGFCVTHKVYPLASEALRKLADESRRNGLSPRQLRTLLFGIAYHCQEYAEARAVYEELKGEPSESALHRVLPGVAPLAVYQESCARSGHAAKGVALAADAISRSAWDVARRHLNAAGETPGLDDASAAYIKGQLALVERTLATAKGDWIDLKFDESLSGWIPVAGTWRRDADADGSAVVGSSTKDGLQLRLDLRLPRAFALRGTCEFRETKYSGLNAGTILRQVGHAFDYGYVVHQSGPKLIILFRSEDDVGSGRRNAPVLNASNTFQLRVHGNRAAFEWNDQLLYAGRITRREDIVSDRFHVSIGGNYWYEGSNVRFSNVQLRMLKEPPDALKDVTDDYVGRER